MSEEAGTAPGSGPLITQPFIAIVGRNRRTQYKTWGLTFEATTEPCKIAADRA
jgi:hypothetical protein